MTLTDTLSRFWAITWTPAEIEAWMALAQGELARLTTGPGNDDDELDPDYEIMGNVAVVTIRGVLMAGAHPALVRRGMASDPGHIAASLEAAMADPDCRAVLLDVSSPGGTIDGIQECADALAAASAGGLPMAAHASNTCASAALWLASQAGTLTAHRTAQVGGIGVFKVVYDRSEQAKADGVKVHVLASGPYKGTGVPGAPVTAEQLQPQQDLVDGLAAEFVQALARGRKLAPDAAGKLATGRAWLAAEAQALGLVDAVHSRSAALSALNARIAPAGSAAARHFPTAPQSRMEAAMPTDKNPLVAGAATPEQLQAQSVAHLKALELAFPEHAAFAREQWEAGATPDTAKAAHYAIVCSELKAAQTAKAGSERELAALKVTHADLKATVASAGLKPLAKTPGTEAAPPGELQQAQTKAAVLAYETLAKQLTAQGDKSPEMTIAEKYPQVRHDYLEAASGR